MATLAQVILRGNIADRPTDNNNPDTIGRLYIAEDEGQTYRDNGTGWDTIKYYRDLPHSALCFHDTARVTVGDPDLLITIDPDQRHNFYAEQNPADDLDAFEFDIAVGSGYYDLLVYCQKGPDCGILEVRYNDDGPMTTFDLYNAAPLANVLIVYNHYKYVPGHTILKFAVNGKNGSSSDFRIPLTYVALRPA